jgi:hypothetical protein
MSLHLLPCLRVYVTGHPQHRSDVSLLVAIDAADFSGPAIVEDYLEFAFGMHDILLVPRTTLPTLPGFRFDVETAQTSGISPTGSGTHRVIERFLDSTHTPAENTPCP